MLLSLLLKGLKIVGVLCRILAVQETVEFLFSVVFAIIPTTFLLPAGFVFVGKFFIGVFACCQVTKCELESFTHLGKFFDCVFLHLKVLEVHLVSLL